MKFSIKRFTQSCVVTSLALVAGWVSAADDEPTAKARNVILFIGDGMGISTITAARIFDGQQRGEPGEENSLSFERFENVALVKTYNTNAQVPDSAGTMSAIMTGVKTKMGVFGVDDQAARGICQSQEKALVKTLLEAAEENGYATGVVSTATLTHATPGATYAHTVDRNWEADSDMSDAARKAGCIDIATQFVEMAYGDGVDIALAGGREKFLPKEMIDPEYPDVRGARDDGRDLTREWQAAAPDRAFVWNAAQLKQTDARQVLGLFEPSHMRFDADRSDDPGGEPSLAELTARAISHLQNHPDGAERGYFLMVEAGRIDHAHHFGNAYRALTDTVALSDAVAVAQEMTSAADTLTLVTADHSHTLTIAGYPRRGNPILGKAVALGGAVMKDAQGQPYTTLGYANGPGHRNPPQDLAGIDTTKSDYQQHAGVPMAVETHAGEDVAAFATGPGSAALRGVIEQNEIFFVLNRAFSGFERALSGSNERALSGFGG
ncbi:MAG: alkaline phosphatase [Pseudomonadaceae bacterium]|nr:alkaline phosphatase [Pseudomonadaceae bacterium]